MIRSIKSYFAAMKATAKFGRASRLSEKGKKVEALALAQEVLAILRAPVVVRTNPAEGSVLLTCTMLVEELSEELNQPGAAAADISDSLAYAKLICDGTNLGDVDLAAWIAYFEAKLLFFEAGGKQ